MKYVVGVDIGGTFTDLICIDENADYIIVKTSSTPKDPSIAVIDGLEKVAAKLGKSSLEEFLTDVVRICHGTTVSTNTVLTWTGAKVGLLCTEGFRDTLGIRFGIREHPYDFTVPAPQALAPRYLRMPIEERIKGDGEILTALNEQQVRDACKYLKEQGVEAVAICFLWSFKNPVHEKRAAEIAREELPGIYVCASCEIQPEVREYWRMSTTVISAYVGPNLSNYIRNLVATLTSKGFDGQLLITQSNAGVISPEVAMEQAVRTVLSGPACAPAAAAYLAGPLGMKDVITVDMGGTSLDICLIKDAVPWMRLDSAVGGLYHMRLPLIDIHTIGAGGGSIAWLDKIGALHVGPASAGADPGPVCYCRGGTEPTSTDADLILGYLNPDYYLGGEIKLDMKRAHDAIDAKIAKPLGMEVWEAARDIRKIIDANMVDGISVVSVQRGEDPRRYAMVAAGGAGPVHSASLARPLGIKKIIVNRGSSIFCALGGAIADLRHDFVRSVIVRSSTVEPGMLAAHFEEMEQLGNKYLDMEGIVPADRYFTRSVDMRYKGQFHEVEVPVITNNGSLSKEDLELLIARFNDRHEELYAYRDEVETEMINLRLAAYGKVVTPPRRELPFVGKDSHQFIKGQRDVYFEESGGFVATNIYDGDTMGVGNIASGPCIIEQFTTTIIVPPNAFVEVNSYGDFEIILS
ncbi:MAG: hydantoinase/oxoprolinase family protein [Deltaproteobacteria bacterium]|nr:hydantoinase/oxoprolinase family protein [Deltaproteobacteria bacterium]